MAISRRILLKLAAPLALLTGSCDWKGDNVKESGGSLGSKTPDSVNYTGSGKELKNMNENTYLSDSQIAVSKRFESAVLQNQHDINKAIIDIRTFGGKADGVIDNVNALRIAKRAIGEWATIKFPSVDGGVYYFGDSLLPEDTSDLVIDVPDNVYLSMEDFFISSDSVFVRPTRVYSRVLDVFYIYSPSSTKRYAERTYWFNSNDRNALTIMALHPDNGGFDFYESYDQQTSNAEITVAELGHDYFRVKNSNPYLQIVGIKYIDIGSELTFAIDNASAGTTVAAVKSDGARYWITCATNMLDRPVLQIQEKGSTAIKSKPIDYFGFSSQHQYSYFLSMISIRRVDRSTCSILVNGFEIVRFETIGDIIGAGPGGAGANCDIKIINPVIKNKVSPDVGLTTTISVFGDSLSMPIVHGCWPDLLRNQLDSSAGIRILNLYNYAIGGNSSNEQRPFVTPENLSKSNVSIFLIGTNDIQGSTGVDVYIRNMKYMFDLALSQNNKIIVGVPPMFYEKEQSGGTGGPSKRSTTGAPYRTALEFLCGEYDDLVIVDLPALTGMISGDFVNPKVMPDLYEQHLDPMVGDNVHPTPNMRMLMAQWFGNAVMRCLLGNKPSLEIKQSKIPDIWLTGKFIGGTDDDELCYSRAETGRVSLSGLLYSKVKRRGLKDGIVAIQFPESLSPKKNHYFMGISDKALPISVLVTVKGELLIKGLTTKWVSLAAISWESC